ncbi:MAG TPA: hypothetical protein VLC09_06130, partial [Polyangiaceae bacterium]|nr:hypothetical protein [Polyangiaceae bacterium]
LVALDRPHTSPRIQGFADWMVNEAIIASETGTFPIVQPRSQVANSPTSDGLGASTEEFAYCNSDVGGPGCENNRSQQFSFNTPYAAPDDAICGRVAYSAFHVSVGDSSGDVFPAHCAGDLSAQEKVLLYMLFDLGACVGDEPPPPPCTPITCPEGACGKVPNGCGGVIDCGTCGGPTN